MGAPLDEDPEFRGLLERQRRFAARRALRMALVMAAVTVGGALSFAYGRSLDAAQAHSDVHFYFPGHLMFVGASVTAIGLLSTVVAVVVAVRSRTRRGL